MQVFEKERLQFVARAMLQKSHAEWRGLDQDERRAAIALARRALSADQRYAARLLENAED